jgi:orotidine-5'-phosphate decarboxylase
LISAATHNVKYVTIHLEEGEALREIPQEVKDANLEILAVTVLTSISEKDLYRYDLKNIMESISKNKDLLQIDDSLETENKLMKIVTERVIQAIASGCAGVICSGEEVDVIKTNLLGPGLKAVVPGIRPDWSNIKKDDQSRVTTPGQAIERGADLIVVGRPIRDADDPIKAADRILEEISEALQQKK